MALTYVDTMLCSFEFDVTAAPDGTFTIDRIMPGHPFTFGGSGGGYGCPSSCGASSRVTTLKPGEVLKGVVLTVPQAAAVRGVIVDEGDAPVRGMEVAFLNKLGQGVIGACAENDNRFGMSGLTPNTPLRIEAPGNWIKSSRQGIEISLKPGEMRFVKLVMKKTPAK